MRMYQYVCAYVAESHCSYVMVTLIMLAYMQPQYPELKMAGTVCIVGESDDVNV